MQVWYWLVCIYLFIFLFLAVSWVSWGNCWWGIKCAEIYASRPDHLIIFSAKLFSQPDHSLAIFFASCCQHAGRKSNSVHNIFFSSKLVSSSWDVFLTNALQNVKFQQNEQFLRKQDRNCFSKSNLWKTHSKYHFVFTFCSSYQFLGQINFGLKTWKGDFLIQVIGVRWSAWFYQLLEAIININNIIIVINITIILIINQVREVRWSAWL